MGQPHEQLTVQYATQTLCVTHWQTTVQMDTKIQIISAVERDPV
jgi:hypothetical protein